MFERIEQIVAFQRTGDFAQRGVAQENESLLTSRLQLLPLLFDYLRACSRTNYSLLTGFGLIQRLLEKRGCLLTPDQMTELLGSLFAAIRELAPTLVQEAPMLNTAAKALAVGYHLVFEVNSDVPFDDVFAMLADENPMFKLIGVRVMQNIVESFYIRDFTMPHLVSTERDTLKSLFRGKWLMTYFQKACEILVSSSTREIQESAMVLLLACLKYDAKDDDSKADIPRVRDYQFTVTDKRMLERVCMSTEIPTVLFDVYRNSLDNPPMQVKALEVLMYFSSTGTPSAAARYMGESRLTYLQFVAGNLTGILNENINPQVTQDLARLLVMVSSLIPVPLFIRSGDAAFGFFDAAQRFSMQLWGQMQDEQFQDAANYMLNFWAMLADTWPAMRQSMDAISSRFVDLFPDVFRGYLDALLRAVDPDPDNFDARFSNFDTFIDEAKALWSVANMVKQQASEHVAMIIQGLVDELIASPQTIVVHRLAIMILIVAARLKMRILLYNVGEGDVQLALLISSVFTYIDKTNPILKGLAQNLGPAMDSLERALKLFVMQFKRDFLSGSRQGSQRTYVEQIYQNLAVVNNRKAAFDFIVNRFLMDLNEFTQCPRVLRAALDFLDGLIAAKGESEDLKQYAASHELLQGLIQRRISIDFRAVPNINETKKIIPMLNRIYSRSIKTQDAWNQFLAHFDALYDVQARQNYQNGADVFFLNREVYGVLTGTSSHIDYLHVFRWFMKNHVGHTIQSIQAHRQNRDIVHIIYRTWYMICSNKGKKLLLPPESAEGIVLFHSTLDVCRAIGSTDIPEDDKAAFICKLIRPSISETYANFDVMKHYNDDHLAQMIDLFFAILRESPFERFSSLPSGLMTVLGSLESIATTCLFELEPGDRLDVTLQFLWRSLLEYRGQSRDVAEQRKSLNCFKTACNTLKAIMRGLMSTGNCNWSLFHWHFVALLDAIIESQDYIGDSAAAPLCYIAKCDTAFVEGVFSAICMGFDEQYRPGISELLNETFMKVNEVDSPDHVQKFRSALNAFKRGIVKYALRLSDIPEFRRFLVPGSEE